MNANTWNLNLILVVSIGVIGVIGVHGNLGNMLVDIDMIERLF